MAGPDVVSISVITLIAGLSLAKLWLRLWFRLRNERERRRYLRLASTLPAGSQVQEQREDGSHLTVTVGDTPRNEDR